MQTYRSVVADLEGGSFRENPELGGIIRIRNFNLALVRDRLLKAVCAGGAEPVVSPLF